MSVTVGLIIGLCSAAFYSAARGEDFVIERCQLLPLPNQQVQFLVDGVEKLKWHFSDKYPRPFFYPFNGPSGVSLTRMGHPGAQNHDHHRSVWFAHHKVNGIDFWSDQTKARVRQKQWYRYRDGNEEAVMACLLGWYDEDGREIMEQDVVAALRPLPNDEHLLELQLTFRPSGGSESVSLDKTNFGLLAVRVSKTLSEYFGGGQLTNSEGAAGEASIFGKTARWMDYSGPVVVGEGAGRHVVREGMTYFDHPHNPRYPTSWHVREDGWMGASFCREESWTIEATAPLVLRYLLHAHAGNYDESRANRLHAEFTARPGFAVRKPNLDERHRQFEVERQP